MLILMSKKEYEERYPVNYRDPAMTKRDIAYLKEWISKQPHLPQNVEDEWLKSYLIGCKYSLEKCKKKLDAYFTIRAALPEWFSNRDPLLERMRRMISILAAFFLPTPHPNGSLIAYAKLLDYDHKKIDVLSCVQWASIAADCYIRHTYTHNIIFIMDCKGGTFQHTLIATPSRITLADYCVKNAYPFHVKGVHIINTPPFADAAKKLVWHLVPEKVKQRVHFHTDKLDKLYGFVPQELLPNELGGKAGTTEELRDSFLQRLYSCRDWFMDHAEKMADETKRPEKRNLEKTLFGPEGSFRTLQID